MLDTILTVPVRNWSVSSGPIPIGYKGESKVTTIVFDFNSELVDAVYTLEIEGEFKAFKILQRDGNRLSLTVERDLTAGNLTGLVDLQLVATAEGAVVKTSNIFPGRIYPSINAGDEFPEAEISEFQKALMEYNAKLQRAIDAAESASQSAESAESSVGIAQTSAEDAIRARDAAVQAKTDAVSAAESAEQAKAGTARDAVIASDFANKAEYAKTDAAESARKAQTSATESARHASDSASSADLAGRSVEAIRSMSADAETLDPGSDATASYDIGANRLHFGIPRGLKGDKGDAGERGADGINGRDGRDGVDGRTPMKGVDYFTASDIDEVVQETIGRVPKYTLPMAGAELGGVKAGLATAEDNTPVRVTSEGYMRVKVPPAYDDAEVKADIESLESKKVGYSEVSGNQLLMYTDSTKTTLLAALDLPAAPVLDIVIENNSLVGENGIASIGLGSGLYRTSTNSIGVNFGAENYIDRRSSSHVLGLNKLPYAVKSAMSAPISDTDPEWSAAEKLAAKERMGLEKEWTLVGRISGDANDRGNIDSGAVVNLDGCTELILHGYGTSTGTTILYAKLSNNENSLIIYNAITSSTKTIYAHFRDSLLGFENLVSKKSDSRDATSIADQGGSGYCHLKNKKISDIIDIHFGNPAVITDWTFNIYAR